MKKFFQKDCIIGLDIGSSSIKLAKFIKKESGFQLLEVRIKEIQQGEEMVFSLKSILSAIELRSAKVITLLNSPQAMVKRVVVPQMPRDELRGALALELKNCFPFSVTDSLIDFEVVGEVMEKGVKKLEVLLAVCPHQAIKEHIALLRQVGISPAHIIHPSVALHNLLRRSFAKEISSFAVIDIGKIFSELVIVRDGKFVFSRKIPISGDDFTKALTATLFSSSGKIQLGYDDAERIKREYGIPQETATPLIENIITPIQVRFLLRPLAERLAHEIERSFDFYREESQGGKVEKLILMGGSARLKGLDKFLSDELGIEIALYDVLEGIAADPQALSADTHLNRIAGAIGCAINKPTGINLLPLEIKQQMQRLVRQAAIKAAASACLTLLILLLISLRIQAAGLDKKIAGAKFELQALSKQLGDTQNWGLLSDILKGQVYGEDILKEISNVIPVGICLKSLSLQDRAIEIRGIVASSYSQSEGLISGFIRSLEAGIFKNVSLLTIQEAGGIREFRLKMEME